MENITETNLVEIINEIRNNDLLLPDFQRGFVWGNDEQKRLVASVLARMPIGSILGLAADADEYGCRILGRKETPNLTNKKSICVLLDGQQRMTVLANVFSNLLFYDYENGGGLKCGDYTQLVSTDLQYRFFLRIPIFEKLKDENDWFGLRNLEFSMDNITNGVPKFLTRDILKYIHTVSYDKDTKEAYAPNIGDASKIISYFKDEEFYYIPLYLLINDSVKDTTNETIIGYVLKNIVEDVVRCRMLREFDQLSTLEEKKTYIKEQISFAPNFDKIITADEIKRDLFEACWKELGNSKWASKMLDYLHRCIEKLDLHQIKVDKSDRNRAIDIYENLNMGGVTLSTFELILAKAAKNKFPDNKNLFQTIVTYIQTGKTYDEAVVPDNMNTFYNAFIDKEKEYSATESMNCYDEKKNQLSSKYTDVFLNVLSLICYAPDYDVEKIDVPVIKRGKILDLDADQILANYERACEGIDRACFFLQCRCGVRKIQEFNYNLLLVLLGYIFSSDVYYKNHKVSKALEAWYWAAIFSGRYDKDQTENIIEDIKNIIGYIKDNEKKWLEEMKDKMFDMQGFSDKDTLLMRTSVIPKNVLRKTICQYYLSEAGKDLRTDEVLTPFSDSADSLEEHHIVPLGSMKNFTYKKMEKENRKDKKSIFNSPLNFAYITKKSNREISNLDLEYYIKCCNKESVYSLNISLGTKDKIAADDIEVILEKRFEDTKQSICKRIQAYF